MLAHLARQVGQDFVPLAYHALYYGSVDGNHIFFWNDVTSLLYGPNP
jgi:hypothetical protein